MQIHQIKIEFNVTEQIKRYVYVYLLIGKHCYMIDSGVAGCQDQILHALKECGKELSDLKGIFLTHAHPDHIGTASWFKEETGCKIYAGKEESRWIEDIDLQYKERPIPSFYRIAGQSVKVDQMIKDGDEISLDETFSINVIGTPGHSVGEMSYKVGENLFIGDSIPVKGDIPIYVDKKASLQSLDRIKGMKECKMFYPAWDVTYDQTMIQTKIKDAIDLIHGLDHAISEARKTSNSIEDIARYVCESLQCPMLMSNPLFLRTIRSHL